MNREAIVAATEAYAASKNAHDVGTVVEAYAPNGFYLSAAFGEPVRGREKLTDFYRSLFSALPDYEGDFDEISYGENTAVAWGCFRGTTADDFFGVKVESGRAVEVPVCFVCTFADDGIQSEVGYFDAATLAQQLGIRLEALRPSIAATFIARYEAFWAAPDPELVPQGGTPDIRSTWVGRSQPIVGIAAYQEHVRQLIAPMSEMSVKALDFLAEGDVIFIEFEASCLIADRRVRFRGLDRFRLRDGVVSDGLTMYDPTDLQEAIAAGEAVEARRQPGDLAPASSES
jgi:steroid delta-isomerase-like uncharacterized protein